MTNQNVISGMRTSLPDSSEIILKEEKEKAQITIPPKGIKGKGLITLLVIGLWLFTILVWTIFMLLIKPVTALYSLPFWAIGLWTFFKALSMLRIEQSVILEKNSITLKVRKGDKADERTFYQKEFSVSLIEGSYHSYTGLNRRGQYPAIIYKDESYGFAERCTSAEKMWILQYINSFYDSGTNH